jgi:hypothetical protein
MCTLYWDKDVLGIKNVSAKNYSYEAQKILVDEVNKDINKINGGVNGGVNGEINKVNSEYDDFIFIHKYGLEVWLKT